MALRLLTRGMRVWFFLFFGLMGAGLLSARAEEKKLKAGFVYVGPIGDQGYTYAHDQGRLAAEKALPWLETTFAESVPEGDAQAVMDLMIKQGAKVIFATSSGYNPETLAVAKRHPDIIFANASGVTRASNVATYWAEAYQVDYLMGLIAGALTHTGKVGYVAPFPTSEIKRHVNSFALGVHEANPKASLCVRWIFAWYNPSAAKEAASALIGEGSDIFCFGEDSPTVAQVAAQHQMPSFSIITPMDKFAPDFIASGLIVHQDIFYLDFLKKVHDGTYTPKNLEGVDHWGLLASGAVELAVRSGNRIDEKYAVPLRKVMLKHPTLGSLSAYDLVLKRLEQMSKPTPEFDPWDGPVLDRKGVIRIKAGVHPGRDVLLTMDWAAPGIVGPWPQEP
jgi:simple sugar transport system substrate-binding protein